jgi:hypothetical protein
MYTPRNTTDSRVQSSKENKFPTLTQYYEINCMLSQNSASKNKLKPDYCILLCLLAACRKQSGK